MKSKKSENLKTVKSLQTKMFAMISYIQENMVTRREFDEKFNAMYNHVDGFIKLHQVLDTEVVSLRHGYSNLDERLTQVEKKVGLDE